MDARRHNVDGPKLFIAENVKGLANLEDAKEVIEHGFAEAGDGGYIVVPAKVLHAPDYGVPQTRERVIFFGFKKSALMPEAYEALEMNDIPAAYDPYPPKTHGAGLAAVATCGDAPGPTIRSEHHGNIEYRRLNREHGGKHIEELEAGLLERRLTVMECARIQAFPDSCQFILKKTPNNVSVSSSDAYKIIGNAVPVCFSI